MVGWVGKGPPDFSSLRETQSLSHQHLLSVAFPSQRGRSCLGATYQPQRLAHTHNHGEVAGEQLLREASSFHWRLGPQWHGRRFARDGARVARGYRHPCMQCRIQWHNWRPASATPTVPRGQVPLPRGRDQAKVDGRATGREGNARRTTSDPSQRGPRAPRRKSNAQVVRLTSGPPALHADPAVGNCPRGLPP